MSGRWLIDLKRRAPGAAALMWLLAGCSGNPGGRALPQATTQPAELAAVTAAAPSRDFVITCTANIPSVPAEAKRVDFWVPVPSSDAQQAVRDVRVITSLPNELRKDPDYGNAILHVWSDHPSADAIDVTVRYRVERRAEQALPSEPQANVSCGPEPDQRLLAPDRLGVIDGPIRVLAARITAGKTGTLAKGRAIYDYVIAHMSYDKQAPGWGRGDTRRACQIGKGNCTDFHALFISLARASGIPARFGIGFQVPPDQRSGTLAGYHCWAEFWLPGTGWVPVDASEAWKDPGKRGFYFGSLDNDRFRVSLGRDVRLPERGGEPVNFLLPPVAEADGRPIKVEKVVTFTARP